MTSIITKRQSLHKNLKQQLQENRTLESQLARTQALANIGTVTCMIAHEINNLLTPLLNYSELALRHPEDEQLSQKALNKTMQNCNRICEIMQSMLSVASGGKENETETANLCGLIDQIFQCLCRDFGKDGIEVRIKVPAELELVAVRSQIQQVLMNLILNARDAMLEKGGVLTIYAEKDANTVIIDVCDTGVGIRPADLSMIFDPFFSTKRNEQNSDGGTGLGLAFCKKIVESHGGSISVESQPHKGAKFKIILPQR